VSCENQTKTTKPTQRYTSHNTRSVFSLNCHVAGFTVRRMT
jgi:hypothetical protein